MKKRLLLLLCVGTLAAVGCAPVDEAATSSDDLTEDDLAGQPFLEQGTYTGTSVAARSGVETEATYAASCTDGIELVKMLHATRDGKTGYQRVKTPNVEQAYSTEYGVDQMLWDGDSHELREQTPFLWLSIEPGRFDVDAAKGTGERELSLGTDIMDDTYYDAPDFVLTDNEMELRARARWDTPTQIRRILIGNKVGSSVDTLGIKKAAKEDMRRDSASAENIASLDTDVRRGFVKWNGTDAVATPVREVYEQLVRGGKLTDVGTHKQVLLLKPQIHVRQTRSRFHLNEVSWSALNSVRQLGGDRLRKVATLIAEARSANALSAADEALVRAWEKKAAGAQDGSLLAERAAAAVAKVDASADVTPAGMLALVTFTNATRTTDAQLEARRIASEAESAIFHELGTELDGIRRLVTMSSDRTLENEPARFVRWLKSADNTALGTTKASLALLRTYDRFVELHAALIALPAAAREAQLAAYNDYAKAQVAAKADGFDTFVPLTPASFPLLGRQLQNEKVRIYQRQLQASGSAARGQWFDASRQHFVPRSIRQTGQFIIDSTDAAEMFRHADWEKIPADQRTAAAVLPTDNLLWGTLSNDVQIELGLEQPYIDRIEELQAQPASAERDAQLTGAVAVYDEYRKLLQLVSTLKGPKVMKELKRAGVTSCTEWKPIDGAKGVIGFSKLRGK